MSVASDDARKRWNAATREFFAKRTQASLDTANEAARAMYALEPPPKPSPLATEGHEESVRALLHGNLETRETLIEIGALMPRPRA